MIDQKKIDRMRAMAPTKDTFKCEVLQPDGEIKVKEHMTFSMLQEWLIAGSQETPQRMVCVTNESSGKVI